MRSRSNARRYSPSAEHDACLAENVPDVVADLGLSTIETRFHRTPGLLALIILREALLVEHSLCRHPIAQSGRERGGLDSREVDQNDRRVRTESPRLILELPGRSAVVPFRTQPDGQEVCDLRL